jgi:hypothetical protein
MALIKQLFDKDGKQILPNWAVPRKGDESKWIKPGFFETLWRNIKFDCHVECGGTFREVGSSGILTHRIYWRCDRCGEQRNGRVEY